MTIVALRALGLGDFLTAVPAFRALQDAHPGASLTVAAPRALAPLAPELHDADLLVNLHGRGPHSHRVALGARPRRLIAFAHPAIPETAGMPRWRPREHEVARWCRLLAESGLAADPARLDLPAPPLPDAPARARGATIVHPGAASAARRWPPERFARVAAAEARAGRTVLLTGSATEAALAAEVAARAGLPPDAVLAGRTTLRQLAAVVAAAGRVICGDTGVAHLATAMGVSSVLLFGPTSPAEWGPFSQRRDGNHRVLWAGRRGDPHADRPHEGLLAIQPGDVLAELATLP